MATPRTRAAATRKANTSTQSRDKTRHTRARRAPGEAYFALVRRFPLRPIESEAELERARTALNELLDRDSLDRDEEDYLDVLGLLIADYEDSIYEHPEFTPVERLRHLMEEHDLSQAELARRAAVAVTSLSDILNGKRRISPRVRAKFAECFGVSASFFA